MRFVTGRSSFRHRRSNVRPITNRREFQSKRRLLKQITFRGRGRMKEGIERMSWGLGREAPRESWHSHIKLRLERS